VKVYDSLFARFNAYRPFTTFSPCPHNLYCRLLLYRFIYVSSTTENLSSVATSCSYDVPYDPMKIMWTT
jgi:hypothetical protein